MAQWMRIVFVVCVLGVAGWALADPPANSFSNELDKTLYDCTFVVTPPAPLPDEGGVTLTLEAGTGTDAVQLAVRAQSLQLEAVVNGKASHFAPMPLHLQPGTPYPLTVLRRGDWLGILHNKTFLFRGTVPRPAGDQGEVVATAGWTVDDPEVQPLEPVVFADNFMRTSDVPGEWRVRSGKWALQSAWDFDPKGNADRFANIEYSQNPFAWTGRNPHGAALCTAGKAFWENYTFSVAVQPGAGGAAGVMVNLANPGDANSDGYLVRWSPANDHGPQGDRLTLSQVKQGATTVIAESRGGYIPNQWYKLTVISTLDGLRVLVDGEPRLEAKNVWPWRGGVGLYAEGKNGAVFDDVTVYGNTINKTLLEERQQAHINERFQRDQNGMQSWATRNEWTMFPGEPNRLLYDADCYGNQWMALNVRPFKGKTGELQLVLNSDGKSATSGYRVALKLKDGKLDYEFYANTVKLATVTKEPLSTGTEYSFRFHHEDDKLWLEQDGELVAKFSDLPPLDGRRPAYNADGCFALAHDVMLMGRNRLDYGFSEEPVDWVQQGTWMQASRWACSPQWSFLGGWSRGDAVLWHKKRFTGDQSFDAFLGLKIEYPHERTDYPNRYRDFGVAICSDGHDPRSGYAGIYGAADAAGHPNQRTVLLRHGVVVASAPLIIPGDEQSHQQWFELELRKQGAQVQFWVNGVQACTYTDPHPIDEGVPAIWTMDNGIMVARAQLRFANPPQARTEPQVLLDTPQYPEWINFNKPLVLSFPGAWSTSGRTVALQATARKVPKGDEAAVSVSGTHVTLAPTKLGEHWYQVTALDGKTKSAPCHVSFQAFNPAIKRNDAHAVVLYRFTEGAGKLVHDQAKGRHPADLMVAPGANITWHPGQGLTLHRRAGLKTTGAVAKLMRLAKNKACTLECWVSPDSVVQSEQVMCGCLLSWQKNNQANFGIWYYGNQLQITREGAERRGGSPISAMNSYHIGLHHYVLTWNGKIATWYVDGERMTQQTGRMLDPDKWTSDAYLQLGDLGNDTSNFLGTYYLLAIHDRCFSANEVQHNYKAGPSAT